MVNHPNRSRRRLLPGQRMLWQNDLRESWELECYFNEGLMIRARRGNAVLSAPAEAWIVAPDDWQDAPPRPSEWDGRYDLLHLPHEAWAEADFSARAAASVWWGMFYAWDEGHRRPLLKRLQEIGR